MDFLDPKRKKSHRRRLFIGYMLMAIAVAMGALILLFLAYGYDIDRGTGDVIQNGIVFIDSKPGGAAIFVNGEEHKSKTSARLAMPAGNYTIRLDAANYRTWTRTILLEGGQLERLVYPLLVPSVLKPVDLQLYSAAPSFATQSPDRHWLVVQQPGQSATFEQFDLGNPTSAPSLIQIPAAVLTDPAKGGSWSVVEWSNDNRHVVLDRVYESKHEFILFDREQPALSVNVSTLFGVPVSTVQLRNKKYDQLYVYDNNGGILRSADVKAKTVSGPIASNVINFKSYNDNLLFYITTQGAPDGKVSARIMENNNAYTLRQFPVGSSYVMDFAQFDDDWYYAVGTASEGTIYVYRNPLNALKGKPPAAPSVATIMRISNPQFISFSANTRFLAVQSTDKLAVYDAEDDRQFKYTLAQPIEAGQKLKWMDGHRLTYVFNKKGYMVDFDGSNPQELGSVSGPGFGPFFDRDYDNFFLIGASQAVTTRSALVQVPLKNR